ncbi:MAG: restriction endonuclease subunit S [Verrucomicrobiota bacterium]
MAGEWRDVALGDVADELTVGYVGPMASEYVDEGIPFLRSLNVDPLRINRNDLKFITPEFHQRIGKSRLSPGDVVIVRTGKPGACSVVPEWLPDANCSDIVIVRCGKQLDNRFLAYYVNTVACNHIAAHLVGAVQQHFNVGSARTMRINLPPLASQKAIASVLGSLDDMIEANREINEILEEMARALFKSWFVDFDPVRAKLEGRQPAGMDAATAALFPDHFQDSELGQIPRGWRNATIGDICEINNWSLGKNDKLDTLEYVEISEVNRGNIANVVTYHRGDEPSRARRRLRHGDTVLSTVRPDRGAYFLALNPPENRVASTGFAVVTPSKTPWSYVHAAMTQPDVSDHLGHLADGGAYPAVRPEIISAIEVVIPNTSVILDAFQQVCAPLFEMAESNRLESRELAALRDTLLPKLLSGEVRVVPMK